MEGTTLGHYRLLRRLCRGGMSEVYLAHDEQKDRDVAIKVVNSNYVDHVERLQREVKAIRTLTHEHILPILDYGEEGSWYYLVMPYIEHGTLRGRLAKAGHTIPRIAFHPPDGVCVPLHSRLMSGSQAYLTSTHNYFGGPAACSEGEEEGEDTSREGSGLRPLHPHL